MSENIDRYLAAKRHRVEAERKLADLIERFDRDAAKLQHWKRLGFTERLPPGPDGGGGIKKAAPGSLEIDLDRAVTWTQLRDAVEAAQKAAGVEEHAISGLEGRERKELGV